MKETVLYRNDQIVLERIEKEDTKGVVIKITDLTTDQWILITRYVWNEIRDSVAWVD